MLIPKRLNQTNEERKLERLKKYDYSPKPISGQNISREKLNKLLTTPYKFKLFHFHKWVYYTFGPATKIHRVCSVCYKKQKNNDVTQASSIWRPDNQLENISKKLRKK